MRYTDTCTRTRHSSTNHRDPTRICSHLFMAIVHCSQSRWIWLNHYHGDCTFEYWHLFRRSLIINSFKYLCTLSNSTFLILPDADLDNHVPLFLFMFSGQFLQSFALTLHLGSEKWSISIVGDDLVEGVDWGSILSKESIGVDQWSMGVDWWKAHVWFSWILIFRSSTL